jgi:4-hydroxybenzoate polyprenyltransferase
MYESISHFGIKTGIIRSFVYIVLMSLCFYAGFIAGLFLVMIIAIGILIYFFRYFIKLFI